MAVAGVELITALASTFWGVILYFVILFLLVRGAAAVGKHRSHRLFLVLGLVPLMRIISLSVPLDEFSQIYWYLIISIPLLAGVFAVIRLLNLYPQEIGLNRGSFSVQGRIALTGIILGLIDYFILRPEPLALTFRFQDILVPAIILLLTTGLVEELMFRGVMQTVSEEELGSRAWIFIAVLFVVLQIGHLSALHFFFVLPVALFYGLMVKRTGSILGVSLSHGLLTIFLYLIFPFVFT
jgi:membrane protease YdiL (CAAX protease family)